MRAKRARQPLDPISDGADFALELPQRHEGPESFRPRPFEKSLLQELSLDYALRERRRSKPNPSKPDPIRTNVTGSGTSEKRL